MRNVILTLLLFGLILVVTSIFAISTVKKYQEKTFNTAYNTMVQKISKALDELEVVDGEYGFDKTMMYSPYDPNDYSETSGKFLEKYIGISKSCGNIGSDCFAIKYFDTDGKKEYTPKFEGSCAILKNSMSICLKPQIQNQNIVGIIDVNGTQGPNVLDKDLRKFSIEARQLPVRRRAQIGEVEIYKDENEEN